MQRTRELIFKFQEVIGNTTHHETSSSYNFNFCPAKESVAIRLRDPVIHSISPAALTVTDGVTLKKLNNLRPLGGPDIPEHWKFYRIISTSANDVLILP